MFYKSTYFYSLYSDVNFNVRIMSHFVFFYLLTVSYYSRSLKIQICFTRDSFINYSVLTVQQLLLIKLLKLFYISNGNKVCINLNDINPILFESERPQCFVSLFTLRYVHFTVHYTQCELSFFHCVHTISNVIYFYFDISDLLNNSY